MLHAGDGAGRDARSALQILRRDARERHTLDIVTGSAPRLAGNAQHGALSHSSITDDDRQIAAIGDMRKGVGLLAGKVSPRASAHANTASLSLSAIP